MRTPEELIRLYWDEVWNNGNVELVREICGNPIIRHDPDSTTALSHDEQIARITQQRAARLPYFTHEVIVADHAHVTSVWNMVTRAGEPLALCGIEVFRVENGRLTHAWNSSYVHGAWGREGDPSVPATLPPPELLHDPKQIDREWLQRVFAAAGVSVPRIAMISAVTPIGHGTMSDTVRAEIAYNADATGAPASVICKFSSRAPNALALNARFGFFSREVEAYRFFGSDPGFRTPRAWFAEVDETGTTANLVLEDFSQSTIAGDQIAGCSVAEATAVAAELARMHVRYWQSPELAGKAWLHDPAQSADDLEACYVAGADIFRERYSGRLTEVELALIDGFRDHVGTWARREPGYRTLVHSDPRVDNILFEKLAEGEIRACLIDWQLVAFDDPMVDLAYFLTGSVSPDDRRACERVLVAEHAKCIAKIEPAYTRNVAEAAYLRNIPTGLVATIGSAVSVASTAHNDELLLALVRRNCSAVEDWGGIAAIKAALAPVPA